MIMSGKCLCPGHLVNSNRQDEKPALFLPVLRGAGSFRALSVSDWRPDACGHLWLRPERWVIRRRRAQRLFSPFVLLSFVQLSVSRTCCLLLSGCVSARERSVSQTFGERYLCFFTFSGIGSGGDLHGPQAQQQSKVPRKHSSTGDCYDHWTLQCWSYRNPSYQTKAKR